MIAPTLSGQYNINQPSTVLSPHQTISPYTTSLPSSYPAAVANNNAPIMHHPPVQIALGLPNSTSGMVSSNHPWVTPGSATVGNGPSWDSRHTPSSNIAHSGVYSSYDYQQNNNLYPPPPNMSHGYPIGAIPAPMPIQVAPALPDHFPIQNSTNAQAFQQKVYNKEFPPLA